MEYEKQQERRAAPAAFRRARKRTLSFWPRTLFPAYGYTYTRTLLDIFKKCDDFKRILTILLNTPRISILFPYERLLFLVRRQKK